VSRSYRTAPDCVLADRRVAHRDDGTLVSPRIVSRDPRQGDVHPLTKSGLTTTLDLIPATYLYGLSRIELLPLTAEIGQPFGRYRPSEKSIVLYSLPLRWEVGISAEVARREVGKAGARVTTEGGLTVVTWDDHVLMSFWFLFEVLLHELGHHYRHQYRFRRGPVGRTRDEERIADILAHRVTCEWIRAWTRRRPSSASQETARPRGAS
jgi:hypothetical protein